MKHASILFDLLELQLRTKYEFSKYQQTSPKIQIHIRIGQSVFDFAYYLYFNSLFHNKNEQLYQVDCYYNDKNIPKFLQEIYNQLTEL